MDIPRAPDGNVYCWFFKRLVL